MKYINQINFVLMAAALAFSIYVFSETFLQPPAEFELPQDDFGVSELRELQRRSQETAGPSSAPQRPSPRRPQISNPARPNPLGVPSTGRQRVQDQQAPRNNPSFPARTPSSRIPSAGEASGASQPQGLPSGAVFPTGRPQGRGVTPTNPRLVVPANPSAKRNTPSRDRPNPPRPRGSS